MSGAIVKNSYPVSRGARGLAREFEAFLFREFIIQGIYSET